MTYISTYSDEKSKNSSLTQDKINSCILALHEAIDTYEEDKTVQSYGHFVYDGAYYTGKRIATDAPVYDEPVLIYIDSSTRIKIGTITAEGNTGYLYCSIPMLYSYEDSFTDILSNTTEEYASEWSTTDEPPQDDVEETDTDYSKTTDVYTDSGVLKDITYTKYEVERETREVEDDDEETHTEYRYVGTVTVLHYTLLEYTRNIDMSKVDMHIDMKYLKRS